MCIRDRASACILAQKVRPPVCRSAFCQTEGNRLVLPDGLAETGPIHRMDCGFIDSTTRNSQREARDSKTPFGQDLHHDGEAPATRASLWELRVVLSMKP